MTRDAPEPRRARARRHRARGAPRGLRRRRSVAHAQPPVRAVCRVRLRAADAAAHSSMRQEHLRWPFVYPLRLENRLEHRYVEDRSRPMPLRLFRNGALLSVDAAHGSPWFPLGADALGRDQLARLAWGTRLSLGVALGAALGALVIGALVGRPGRLRRRPPRRWADAGGRRRSWRCRPSTWCSRCARRCRSCSRRPRSSGRWSWCWRRWAGRSRRAGSGRSSPPNGRGSTQKLRARMGASRTRILLRHLLPAARGFLVVQATLLVPAFVLAEATLSFVGLGFSEPIPSWGAMLREAGRGRAVVEAPWLLAPAVAIVAVGAGREPHRWAQNPCPD